MKRTFTRKTVATTLAVLLLALTICIPFPSTANAASAAEESIMSITCSLTSLNSSTIREYCKVQHTSNDQTTTIVLRLLQKVNGIWYIYKTEPPYIGTGLVVIYGPDASAPSGFEYKLQATVSATTFSAEVVESSPIWH